MSKSAHIFKKKAEKMAQDLRHRATIQFNIARYDAAVWEGRKRFSAFEQAKSMASAIKDEAIGRLPELLTEYETRARANGAEVYWAESAEELMAMIGEVVQQEKARLVVKSKSMVTEEVELNHHLESMGVQAVETDLGEFIVQVAGEKPYHIVTPAMHKCRQDIADLFNRHFGTSPEASAEEMTAFVRGYLRDQFLNADIGVTGGNFICAREGAIAVTENEGNAYLSSSMPSTHIVIAGIEKIIPSIHDLSVIWPLLAAHGTGQQLTVYSNLFFGPRKTDESDGPKRMVVFLLDNQRSKIYGDSTLRASLKCIRCGACLNVCPVYKNIGGYTYSATYSGPIGSVLTPHLKNFDEYKHLSFASSLCGRCVEVCPVKIPLTQLLLYNRQQAGTGHQLNHMIFRALKSRPVMDALNGKIKNWFKWAVQKHFIGHQKDLDDFNTKSFSQQWIKHKRT